MHRLIIALACWLVLPALAGQPAILQASSNNSGVWQRLYVGAGGYLIGMSIANDNTMVVNTDTYGAYLWDRSGSSGRQVRALAYGSNWLPRPVCLQLMSHMLRVRTAAYGTFRLPPRIQTSCI